MPYTRVSCGAGHFLRGTSIERERPLVSYSGQNGRTVTVPVQFSSRELVNRFRFPRTELVDRFQFLELELGSQFFQKRTGGSMTYVFFL